MISSKKRTPKKKSTKTSPSTQPELPSLRVFDLPNVRLTGVVIAEDATGVLLEHPAAMLINQVPLEADRVEMRVRFEPLAFAGPRYKLYRSAIRGETDLYEPGLLDAWKRYVELSTAQAFNMTPSSADAPEFQTVPAPAQGEANDGARA